MAAHNQNLSLNLNGTEYLFNNNDVTSDDHSFDLCSNCITKYLTEDSLNNFFHQRKSAAINFLHVNCRSLQKNFFSVTNLLNTCHPLTALALTETWLTTLSQDIHRIPGYNFVSNIR